MTGGHFDAASAAMAVIPFMPKQAKDAILNLAKDVDRMNEQRQRVKVLILAMLERHGASMPADIQQTFTEMLNDVQW